jgi:CRISPR system Cascade subunit CasB
MSTTQTTNSTTTNDRISKRTRQITWFMRNLDQLELRQETGKMAALRRAAGCTIAESRNAINVFYQLLPPDVDPREEEIYFLVATLRFHTSKSLDGSFGKTMQLIHSKSNSGSIIQRANALIDAGFDISSDGIPLGGEIMYRLRQWVRLAKSKDVGIDWFRLLEDLLQWNRLDRMIQKKWAQDFYLGTPEENPAL